MFVKEKKVVVIKKNHLPGSFNRSKLERIAGFKCVTSSVSNCTSRDVYLVKVILYTT